MKPVKKYLKCNYSQSIVKGEYIIHFKDYSNRYQELRVLEEKVFTVTEKKGLVEISLLEHDGQKNRIIGLRDLDNPPWSVFLVSLENIVEQAFSLN